MSSWLHRTILAGLLLTAYLYAWTPLRTQWTKMATVILQEAAPASQTVTARPDAHTMQVSASDGGDTISYRAPAGVKFLLPGCFLLLLAPARPRLGSFWAGHAGLGLLTVATATAGLAGLPGGLGLASFIQQYGVDAYSLAVPAFVFARTR